MSSHWSDNLTKIQRKRLINHIERHEDKSWTCKENHKKKINPYIPKNNYGRIGKRKA